MGFAAKWRDYLGYAEEEEDFGDAYEAAVPAAAPVQSGGYRFALVTPSAFTDATVVIDHFRAGRPVVCNMENVTPAASRRLVDFLNGAAYAQGGQFTRIAAKAYLMTPGFVDLTGEDLEDTSY